MRGVAIRQQNCLYTSWYCDYRNGELKVLCPILIWWVAEAEVGVSIKMLVSALLSSWCLKLDLEALMLSSATCEPCP